MASLVYENEPMLMIPHSLSKAHFDWMSRHDLRQLNNVHTVAELARLLLF